MNGVINLSTKLGIISWCTLIFDIIIAVSPLRKITNPILIALFLAIIMFTLITCVLSSIGIFFSVKDIINKKVSNKNFIISFLINFVYLIIFIMFGIVYYNAAMGI